MAPRSTFPDSALPDGPPAPRPRAPLTLTPAVMTAVVVGGGVALGVANIVQRSVRVIGWFVAAAVAAMFVSAMVRWWMRRVPVPVARTITVLTVLGAVGTSTFQVFTELRGELGRLQKTGGAAARSLERSDRFGDAAKDFGLSAKVNALLTALPKRIAGRSGADTARLASSRGVAFLGGLVLTVFLCANGRRIVQGMVSLVPERPSHGWGRHAVMEVLERGHERASTLLLAMVTKGIAVAIAVGALLWWSDVPAPTLLGVVFGIATLLPGIGPIVVLVPVMPFVIAVTSGSKMTLTVTGLLLIILIDAVAHRRSVRRGIVDLGPFISAAVAFAAFEFGGLGTALCGLAVAGFGASVLSAVAQRRAYMAEAVADTDADPVTGDATRAADTTSDTVDVRRTPDDGFGGSRIATLKWSWADVARQAAVVAVGVLVSLGLLAVVRGTRRTLTWFVIAAVLALALQRIVEPIADRVGGRQRVATAIVSVGAVSVLVLLTVIVGPMASKRAAAFGRELPQMTQRLGNLPGVGGYLRDHDAPKAVERWLSDIPNSLGRDSGKVKRALQGAADAALATTVIAMFTIGMLVDGARLLRRARDVFAPRTRMRLDQSARIVAGTVGRYFAGSLLVAGLAGAASLVTGLALGVPLAPLAAAWIAITNVIPQIGGLLGGVVFVSLGLTQSSTVGAVCLIYFLTYQQIENHIIQPTIVGKAVQLSPVATMMAALIGGSTAGVPGALIAVPLVGAVRSVGLQLMGRDPHAGRHAKEIHLSIRHRLMARLR